ncbi:ATPase AAA [Anaerocolumna cellulosilytica]|uniref:ATPase AAA n=1 Tax=Anaerocolumna cellulosilytica TaxID=433286 RepID=A0A6S6R2J9_9FIRM|nr:AAA family ATPase [Anaerocolumna cellulosilytica]MBB5196337.1 MinD superfamily P-loop ATPase [Anaerocolumna cellulosilytica]BCJ96366.1 ATPase AAA [Anaerocolumna cellulosilytica]
MLQFKKDSIFTRNNKSKTCVEELPQGGIFAVWGSPGTGKTTVAVKLAKYLADHKKNVVLVLCDMTAPMLPCICPPSSLEIQKDSARPLGSLGSILSATHVTDQLVKSNIITHKKLAYLTMIGMLKGENEYTYAAYSRIQAEEFLTALRKTAPYIIIDCSSYIANDILSAVSIMECDAMLRLSNRDLKSISYLSSQLKLLYSDAKNSGKQYKVLSNVKPNQGVEHMAGALGNIDFQLPYSRELEEQYLAGTLLEDMNLRNSKAFCSEIEKIAKEVLGC